MSMDFMFPRLPRIPTFPVKSLLAGLHPALTYPSVPGTAVARYDRVDNRVYIPGTRYLRVACRASVAVAARTHVLQYRLNSRRSEWYVANQVKKAPHEPCH